MKKMMSIWGSIFHRFGGHLAPIWGAFGTILGGFGLPRGWLSLSKGYFLRTLLRETTKMSPTSNFWWFGSPFWCLLGGSWASLGEDFWRICRTEASKCLTILQESLPLPILNYHQALNRIFSRFSQAWVKTISPSLLTNYCLLTIYYLLHTTTYWLLTTNLKYRINDWYLMTIPTFHKLARRNARSD